MGCMTLSTKNAGGPMSQRIASVSLDSAALLGEPGDLVIANDHFFWGGRRYLEQDAHGRAVLGADVELSVAGVVKESRILAHRHEGRLQRRGAIRRQTRRRQERQRHKEWQLGEFKEHQRIEIAGELAPGRDVRELRMARGAAE